MRRELFSVEIVQILFLILGLVIFLAFVREPIYRNGAAQYGVGICMGITLGIFIRTRLGRQAQGVKEDDGE